MLTGYKPRADAPDPPTSGGPNACDTTLFPFLPLQESASHICLDISPIPAIDGM
jgi:hypothetical protein